MPLSAGRPVLVALFLCCGIEPFRQTQAETSGRERLLAGVGPLVGPISGSQADRPPSEGTTSHIVPLVFGKNAKMPGRRRG